MPAYSITHTRSAPAPVGRFHGVFPGDPVAVPAGPDLLGAEYYRDMLADLGDVVVGHEGSVPVGYEGVPVALDALGAVVVADGGLQGGLSSQ